MTEAFKCYIEQLNMLNISSNIGWTVIMMEAIAGNNEKLETAIDMLSKIVEDDSVPKNIREVCTDSIEFLQKEDEDISVRLNYATSNLDEITNDPNIPMYTRTQIWNIVSILESVGNGD